MEANIFIGEHLIAKSIEAWNWNYLFKRIFQASESVCIFWWNWISNKERIKYFRWISRKSSRYKFDFLTFYFWFRVFNLRGIAKSICGIQNIRRIYSYLNTENVKILSMGSAKNTRYSNNFFIRAKYRIAYYYITGPSMRTAVLTIEKCFCTFAFFLSNYFITSYCIYIIILKGSKIGIRFEDNWQMSNRKC